MCCCTDRKPIGPSALSTALEPTSLGTVGALTSADCLSDKGAFPSWQRLRRFSAWNSFQKQKDFVGSSDGYIFQLLEQQVKGTTDRNSQKGLYHTGKMATFCQHFVPNVFFLFFVLNRRDLHCKGIFSIINLRLYWNFSDNLLLLLLYYKQNVGIISRNPS